MLSNLLAPDAPNGFAALASFPTAGPQSNHVESTGTLYSETDGVTPLPVARGSARPRRPHQRLGAPYMTVDPRCRKPPSLRHIAGALSEKLHADAAENY